LGELKTQCADLPMCECANSLFAHSHIGKFAHQKVLSENHPHHSENSPLSSIAKKFFMPNLYKKKPHEKDNAACNTYYADQFHISQCPNKKSE
jgi:hypothetical protein